MYKNTIKSKHHSIPGRRFIYCVKRTRITTKLGVHYKTYGTNNTTWYVLHIPALHVSCCTHHMIHQHSWRGYIIWECKMRVFTIEGTLHHMTSPPHHYNNTNNISTSTAAPPPQPLHPTTCKHTSLLYSYNLVPT